MFGYLALNHRLFINDEWAELYNSIVQYYVVLSQQLPGKADKSHEVSGLMYVEGELLPITPRR
jgi:hypothetical protein